MKPPYVVRKDGTVTYDLIERAEHAKENLLLSEVGEDLLAEVKRLRALIEAAETACGEAFVDYVDDGEPVLAAHILRVLNGEESAT